MKWGSARADVSRDEVAMASLLAEIGELLLWSVAPELPVSALEGISGIHPAQCRRKF